MAKHFDLKSLAWCSEALKFVQIVKNVPAKGFINPTFFLSLTVSYNWSWPQVTFKKECVKNEGNRIKAKNLRTQPGF